MTVGLTRIKEKHRKIQEKLSHICPTCAIIMKIDQNDGLQGEVKRI